MKTDPAWLRIKKPKLKPEQTGTAFEPQPLEAVTQTNLNPQRTYNSKPFCELFRFSEI